MPESTTDSFGSSDEVIATLRALMRQVDFTGSTPLSETLLWLLGCPFEEKYTSSITFRRETLMQPVLPEHRSEVAEALLRLVPLVTRSCLGVGVGGATLAQPMCAGGSILTGLVHSGGWRTCLLQESTAYDLATLTLNFVEDFVDSYEPDRLAAPAVISLLNDWLKPDIHWTSLPEVDVVARHMFGDACWEFELLASRPFVGWAMYHGRPTFLPGLTMRQPVADMHLPASLGCII